MSYIITGFSSFVGDSREIIEWLYRKLSPTNVIIHQKYSNATVHSLGGEMWKGFILKNFDFNVGEFNSVVKVIQMYEDCCPIKTEY